MRHIGIDSENTQFTITENIGGKHITVKRFPGTVEGAIDLYMWCQKESENFDFMQSSDLNHPREFKKFEKHAIDIAAGYFDGAIKAGLIKVLE